MMRNTVMAILRKTPVVVGLFVGAVYAVTVLANFAEDTTDIINVALGITAVLAGLCFAMSASVDLAEKVKDRVNYAGERFFHAAIFFLLATILKYAAVGIGGHAFVRERELLSALLTAPFHFFAVSLFIYAVLDAHTGLRIINDLLWDRLHRMKDWDTLI